MLCIRNKDKLKENINIYIHLLKEKGSTNLYKTHNAKVYVTKMQFFKLIAKC